ncbi:alpha/beta fold hydrolase [Sandaracinobacter neustonicus]|uniref:Alpha/beta fold hydrolase n=1 Tax=Sandaracinobacter neustonicus TaxID=1715348 RepID=A0A501XN59_9SPHN|nr:alpha/beta fold hydrolase [Sandaracinobacter neustonicus]TPE61577.1 alpha/beta fold hydrolase [Sandaracinobacter neustonicus]
MLFRDAFHDGFGTWPLAYISTGGADYGEIQAVAEAVGDGDDGAYYDAWMAAGERLEQEAQVCLSAGSRAGAEAQYLKAAAFYATSYHPIFGEPVDPRIVRAFGKQKAALEAALRLRSNGFRPLSIPFEGQTLPGYFIPAEGRAAEVRPLLILTNGYDGTITDQYFASAVAASRRGYHCLLFDGPGQGEALILQGLRLRPDWEVVVKAVVDVAITLPGVDPARIVLSGWSLGGYLAPRAASGEHRLAACIADPGLWDMGGSFRAVAVAMGATLTQAENLGELNDALVGKLEQLLLTNRRLRWSIVQRGFWVHGVDNLRDYLRSAELFTMKGRAAEIRCPTLLTAAEGDPLAQSAASFFEELRCPKTFLQFTAAEGAGGHCEMMNRSLLNRRVLDWLDQLFAD